MGCPLRLPLLLKKKKKNVTLNPWCFETWCFEVSVENMYEKPQPLLIQSRLALEAFLVCVLLPAQVELMTSLALWRCW